MKQDINMCECEDTFLIFASPKLPCGRCGREIPEERNEEGYFFRKRLKEEGVLVPERKSEG